MSVAVYALALLGFAGAIAGPAHALRMEPGRWRWPWFIPFFLLAFLIATFSVVEVIDLAPLGCTGDAVQRLDCPDMGHWKVRTVIYATWAALAGIGLFLLSGLGALAMLWIIARDLVKARRSR